eukprot:15445609-Alexandrium_andersonii.AAC.1
MEPVVFAISRFLTVISWRGARIAGEQQKPATVIRLAELPLWVVSLHAAFLNPATILEAPVEFCCIDLWKFGVAAHEAQVGLLLF